MNAEEILTKAKARDVEVALTATGDGLELLSAGDPPAAMPAQGGEPSAEPAPADLNTLLARLERAMRQRVPRRVAFRLSLLPELWRCRADSR